MFLDCLFVHPAQGAFPVDAQPVSGCQVLAEMVQLRHDPLSVNFTLPG
jgi:hypothetical protein